MTPPTSLLLVTLALPLLQDSDRGPTPRPAELTEMNQDLALSLDQVLEIALQRDIGLQIGELSVDVTRFNFEGSWGSFDPVVTAQVSLADSQFELQSSIFGNSEIDDTTWFGQAAVEFPIRTGGSFSVGGDITNQDTTDPFQGSSLTTSNNIELSFMQPLLQGAGSSFAESTQREAGLTYRKEIEVHRATRQRVLAEVESAYWDLVAANLQLAVADESLALSREQLDQNVRRLDAGVGTQVEVLQSEADEATKIEQRLLREVELRERQDILKGYLLPGTNEIYWSANIIPLTPLPEVEADGIPDWRAAMVTALEHRPELKRDRLAIEIAEESLVRSQSNRKAQLDLLLSTRSRGLDRDTNDAIESSTKWDYPTHTAALSYRLPIGNRQASNAERAARASLRAARLTHDESESGIVEEVRGAVRRLNYAVEATAAAAKSTELAQEQLDAERARYREGLSTNFQVLEFQEQLSTAQFNLTQAEALFAKARVTLLLASGTLGEK